MSSTNEIDRQKYLYLTEISEPEDNALRLVIEGAHTPGPVADLRIGDIVLPGTREIVADHSTPAWELVFQSYVAYSVRNESFATFGPEEASVGSSFRTYTRSNFLDFVSSGTFADEQHPGPFVHYCILCLNHIIDVVSTEPPEIKRLRAGSGA